MGSDVAGPVWAAIPRFEQTFPTLTEAEIVRLKRFGAVRRYADGERMLASGQPSPGMLVMLSGHVVLTQRDGLGHVIPIIEEGPGQFLAEVGALSGKPALVDAHAEGAVEALLIPPERLRALLIAEADLGERITRALILRRVNLIQSGVGGPLLIGADNSPAVMRLRSFLSRNGWPHQVLDPHTTDTDALVVIRAYAPEPDDFPLVVTPDGTVLKNPSDNAVAQALGMVSPGERDTPFDVAIVGAGPAGLATAVGVEVMIPTRVRTLDCTRSDGNLGLITEEGRRVKAKAVVVASGASYRRPDIENLGEFEGRGVWYWASPIEARFCAGEEVILVGGGNSAGQAAVFLSGHARKVRMMVRARGLAASMSKYLIDRIEAAPNIELMTCTEVTSLQGSAGGLEQVSWRNRETGEEATGDIRNLFLFVGADPATGWLDGCAVTLDMAGFVLTGPQDPVETHGADPLETTVPGVFAVGDVRSASVKRVGAAIGEGAQVVAALHRFLADPVMPVV